ncbi:hypothetical protein LTR70_002448 [Exophiala xenobiotica]|uniref:Uncharacterized protein n=1 Tax=Lithohypha guttulata TaxID=1690604 RepID=A0ABR0KKY7_9EURO|nr:hypothetical protein LTR24_001445 [Lithohypha guttulata]KAK5325476.1 hypothetical protein LTR70_002448 [Exophiala xenobiotica]
MAHETRQPTTVIETTQPWSAAWDGHERNDQAITRSITAAHETTAFNIVKQWEDTRSVSIGSRAETIHPHGYERIITIMSHTRNPDFTKTKKKWDGTRTFNWQGSGTVTFKVASFAEKRPH